MNNSALGKLYESKKNRDQVVTVRNAKKCATKNAKLSI